MSRIVTLQAAFPVSLSEVDVVASVTDEQSRIWFAIYPSGATVTDPTKVIAGTDDLDAPAVDATNTKKEVVPGSSVGDRFQGIPNAGIYDVYAVAAAFDGSTPGPVAGPFVVNVADEYVVPPYPTAADFPDNPNPGAPNGVPSTLPDFYVESQESFWFNKLISKPRLSNPGTNQLAISWELGDLTGETAPSYYVKLFPAGSTPPNNLSEAATDPDLFGAAAAGPFSAIIPGTVDDTGYDVYVTFSSTEHPVFTAHMGLVGGTLVAGDGAYQTFGPGIAVTPFMPANIADWEDGNRTIAVIPQTVIISAN